MAKASIQSMLREVDERYRAIFFTEWDSRLAVTDELVRQTDLVGTDRYRVGELFAGLATAPEVAEGSNYDYYAPQEGKDVIVTTRIFKFAFKATEELRKFNRSGQIDQYARIQAEILDHTVKVMIYNMFNRAFNSSYPTAYDGAALCSTSHSLESGGTASNRLATDADVSESTLEGLIELLLSTPNEDGAFMSKVPSVYMANSANWSTLTKVLASRTTTLQGSGESGNATNAVTEAYNIRPHHSAYLTDTNASYLLADTSPVNVVWASEGRPDLKPVVEDALTDDWVWRAKMQLEVVADTWRGIAGTSGSS